MPSRRAADCPDPIETLLLSLRIPGSHVSSFQSDDEYLIPKALTDPRIGPRESANVCRFGGQGDAPRQGNLTQARKAFAALPPQELRIGKRTMSDVPFVTPVSVAKNIPRQEEDGLLPTLLFQRLFICGTDHYVVFDPKSEGASHLQD